ncbi:hypothetical protein JVT61DRAFT_12975 [Boletus reticuloceps]|uniref:Uncharacterized protein n=1 Tax=Boletus reticuloceps TaxID=495285 RepID=A0A8I2YXF4_9AGAM|nr:hypothetical protein JVT61DRAFT_12975 [Boletus reticuloceps]
MLYTAGNSPLHPQQAQYAHHQHTTSSLLPTPPSSPPTIGMHPAENTISLLESLVAFYHQERMWVYRTRAQLEMGLLHYVPDSHIDPSVEADDPDSPGQLQAPSSDPATSESSSPSPPTKWLKRKRAFNLRLEGFSSTRSMVARGGISKHLHPHSQHRARQSSNLNPASVPASSHLQGSTAAALHPHPSVSMASSNTAVSFYPPAAINTTTLTSPYLCHPSFQFLTTANKQPITPTARYVSTPAHTHATVQPSQVHATHTGPLVLGAGGREPTVQILEMFERMMQARMESCERVTRMVREANKPGGGTGVVGGANLGSVGGPVGGFGGPIGLPVGVGPQGIVGGYSHVQATAQEDDSEMMSTQTPAQQGFMG